MAPNPTMSGLPRAAACPGAYALPHANTTSADAVAGVASHEAAERAVVNDELDKLPDEIRALMPSGSFAVPEPTIYYDWVADTARAPNDAAKGRRLYTPGPTELPGTPDLLITTPAGRLVVLDYKRHADVGAPDRNEQVMAYALAAARITSAREAIVAVAYIDVDEHGTVILKRPLVTREVDEIDLDAFRVRLRGIMDRVAEQRSRAVPDVSEGPHCKHCPALPYCPAKRELLLRLANGAEARELDAMIPLTPRTAAIAYMNLKHAEGLLARIRSAVYAYAAEVDVPLPSGMVLGKRTVEGNEQLDGEIVATVLTELHGSEVADFATIKREGTKAGIERAIRRAGVKPHTPAIAAVLAEVRKRGGASRKSKEEIGEFPPTKAALAAASKEP